MRETSRTFAERLNAAGLSQTQYRDLVHRITGVRRNAATTHRWIAGKAEPPPEALVMLEFIERLSPRDLAKLLEEFPEK